MTNKRTLTISGDISTDILGDIIDLVREHTDIDIWVNPEAPPKDYNRDRNGRFVSKNVSTKAEEDNSSTQPDCHNCLHSDKDHGYSWSHKRYYCNYDGCNCPLMTPKRDLNLHEILVRTQNYILNRHVGSHYPELSVGEAEDLIKKRSQIH